MKTQTKKGRGRPKSVDPKKQVFIYIEQSVIDTHGGIEKLRAYLTKTARAMVIPMIILLLLFSCAKESQDFRDKRIGTYRGTVTFDLPTWQHTRQNNAYITKGVGETELAIQDLGISSYSIAMLINDSYTYYPFHDGSLTWGTLAEYRGRGTFKGDSLIETGTITITSNGIGETGTWITRLKKQ